MPLIRPGRPLREGGSECRTSKGESAELNKKMKIARILVPAVLCGSWLVAHAQEPDNTKVNKQNQPTADQQKNNVSDRDLTKKIRQSIVADKSLSTYAHNVKVISQNGVVTLKGPVRSEDEKKAIESKAMDVVGSGGKVNDEMSVKPEHE
jgi:hyperosmotically inducible protein